MVRHNATFIEFVYYSEDFFRYLNTFKTPPTVTEITPSIIVDKYYFILKWIPKFCNNYVLYVYGDELFFEDNNECEKFKNWATKW